MSQSLYFQAILQIDLKWPLSFDLMNMRRFLHYINKPSLVPIGLQLFKWGEFYILSPSYNLTSDLWPWYVTFDLINKWGFPCCTYDPTLVEIRQSMWKVEPNVNMFSQHWDKAIPMCLILRRQLARIAFWLPNLRIAFFKMICVCIQKFIKMENENTNTRKNKLQNAFSTWTCWRHQLCMWQIKYLSLFLTYLPNKYEKDNCGIVFECISCSVDNKNAIAVFLSINWKTKQQKSVAPSSFRTCYWKHTFFLT